MQLRPYQEVMIQHLLDHHYAALFVEMGWGKTIAMLSALHKMEERPILLIAPIRVIQSVWMQEDKKWNVGLSFSLVYGKPEVRLAALNKKADIYLINPENLVWMFDQRRLPAFQVLVVDESSMFKNVGSKRFRKLRYKIKDFRRRYILTGTPTPNSLLELWPQMFIIDHGKRLGQTAGAYKTRFFHTIDYHGWKFEPNPGAKKAIYERVQDVVLQQGGNLPDLPSFKYNRIRVELDPKHKDFYNAVEEEALATFDEVTITAANVISGMIKCRQIANGSFYDDNGEAVHLHTKKLDALKEVIDATGSNVIVVYNFRHELAEIQKKLKEFDPVVLNQDKNAIDKWNSGQIRVLLLHPASGGHGINLQDGGHTMVWYGLTFSYEQFAQTIKRIHRSGQKHPVVCHFITAKGTVDQLMWKTLRGKRKGQNQLLKALEDYRSKK